MKNVRSSFDYDSGKFVIYDDTEKMTTLINKEVINDFGGLVGEPNSNDVINFYSKYKHIAIRNRIKTNDNNYSKSHISTSDFNR